MGTVLYMGRTLCSMGYMVAEFLVAFRPSGDIRHIHHKEGPLEFLEETLRRRREAQRME